MLVSIFASLLVSAASTDVFADRAWGQFSRSGALSHHVEIVDIAIDGKTAGQLQYRLRLTDQKFGSPATVSWADSRTCPAVRVILTRLRALSPPVIVPPGFAPEPSEILVDGAGYALTVPVADSAGASRISWTSNIGTALAAWVDNSLVSLAPCWKPET